VSPPHAIPNRGRGAAIGLGLGAAFVAAVEMVLGVRLDLLLDHDPSWVPMRVLLVFAVVVAAAAAGIGVARFTGRIASSPLGTSEPVALPFGARGLAVLAAAAILAGGWLRAAGARTPIPLWVDDVSEIAPALALRTAAADVPPWSYPVPFVDGKWGGSVGTLYLEFFRTCLDAFGTTVRGVRAPSLLGGVLSLFTAWALGRAFLPRGGGALTAVILAGLRWHLIVSQWGWVAVVLAPLMDVAALAMLAARRRARPALAAIAGAAAGLGAHVYLSAWIGAAALGLWAVWPSAQPEPMLRRPARAVWFAAGLLLVASPLLLGDAAGRYFARVAAGAPSATMGAVPRYWQPVETAAAALTGPWWTPDPFARHDLPGRSRLGWVVGVGLAAALLKAALSPREELSGFLLCSAAAAFASTMVWGRAGTPNSYRYTYLVGPTAVAAAGGALWLLSAVAPRHRRVAAILLVGAFTVAGARGATDALVVWPARPETFAAFEGQDTLVGRAAARWQRYGSVTVEGSLARSPLVVEAIRRYGLVADSSRESGELAGRGRRFRVVSPRAERTPSERVVERVRDGWGRERAVVLGSLPPRPGEAARS